MRPTVFRLLNLAVVVGATLSSCRTPTPERAEAPQVPIAYDQELFLVPAEYRGPVLIIYGQAGGAVPSSTNGKLTYRVPATGLVRSGLPEPPFGTKVSVAFDDKPQGALRTFPTCEEMRLVRSASDGPATCWIEPILGTAIPNYVSFIVTDWVGIPQRYNRARYLIDSLLFEGRLGGAPKWVEPTNQARKKSGTL